MKGGIGTASITVNGVTVGALIACNALGDVLDPDTAQVVAGARTEDGRALLDTRRALLRGDLPKPLLAGTNTTLGVIATDAVLTKVQANRLAAVAHDGLARAINPVHTMSDGDTLFALATGRVPLEGDAPGMTVLGTMAAEVVARATLRAVQAARSVRIGDSWFPCAATSARGWRPPKRLRRLPSRGRYQRPGEAGSAVSWYRRRAVSCVAEDAQRHGALTWASAEPA